MPLGGVSGQTGAQGPAGPAGPSGAKGENGANGKDGTNGTNGESVAMAEVKVGEASCSKLGGSKFTVGGKDTFACNGKEGKEGKTGQEGSPWTMKGLLPKNSTETGTWSINAPASKVVLVPKVFEVYWAWSPISFAIQLEKSLPEGHAVVVPSGQSGKGGGCPATSNVEKPEAESGYLCIFQTTGEINGAPVDLGVKVHRGRSIVMPEQQR